MKSGGWFISLQRQPLERLPLGMQHRSSQNLGRDNADLAAHPEAHRLFMTGLISQK